MKENLSKWKHIRVLGLEDRLSIPPTVTCGYKAIPIKIPKAVPCRNRKTHPMVYIESHETANSQNTLEEEEQSWRTPASLFQNSLHSPSNPNRVASASGQTKGVDQ